MTITIETGDPRDPQATALLAQSHALMESLFPPESNHYLDISALCGPEISFFVAREGDAILGTGALANKGAYGEVKSMFVDPIARGRGLSHMILDRIEAEARVKGLAHLKLETGNVLEAAHKLYESHGFTRCAAFGDYPKDDPNSIFMEKRLG